MKQAAFLTETDNRIKIRDNSFSFVAGYIWNINKTSKLYASFNGDYPVSDRTNTMDQYSSAYEFPGFNKKEQTRNWNYFGVINYNTRHKQTGEFDIVVKYFNRKQKTNADYLFSSPQLGDSSVNSYHINTYQYGALSAAWVRSIEKLSFNASLTADYSEDQIPTYNNRVYSYFTWYPYLFLNRNFNGHNIRLVTLYREKRPGIKNLSPIIDPNVGESGLIVMKGNPDLEITDRSNLLKKRLDRQF